MASFGETLKRERELREITLREISDATKINIRYLEALETNRFDILPGGLFNKGFIRAYATYIGVDSETMVTSYLHEISTRENRAADLSGGAPPAVHRPAETPRRRANGAPAGEAQQPRPGTPQPRTPASHEATPLAITGIEPFSATAAAHGPAGGTAPAEAISASRVLWGIVALVATAAAMLIVLGFLMPRHVPEGDRLAAAGTSSAPLSARDEDGPATNLEPAAEPITVDPSAARIEMEPRGGAPTDGAGAGLPAGHPASIAAMTSPAAKATPRPTPTPRPAATPLPGEAVIPLHAPEDERSPSGTAPDESPGPMSLRVEASRRTWVQLTCDSREAINWVMRAGDRETMECLRIIRISAADAAAVSLRVNDAPCLSLGEAGERVYGYTIRIDDFGKICPGSRRGRNG